MNTIDQLVMRSMHEYSSERPSIVKSIGRHLNTLGSEGVRNAGLMISAVGICALVAGAAYGLQSEVAILKSAGLEAMHSYRDFTANLPSGTSESGIVQFAEMGDILRHYIGGWSDLPMSGLKVAWAGVATAVAGVGVLGANVFGKLLGRRELDQDDYVADLKRLNGLVARAASEDPAGVRALVTGGRNAEFRIAEASWSERRMMGVSKDVIEAVRLSAKMDETDYGFRRSPHQTPFQSVVRHREAAGLDDMTRGASAGAELRNSLAI
jgi:hypothetical protein